MLNNNQKRYLKSLAHRSKPIVMVGNKGLTDAVLKEIELALDHHELVKIKLSASDREEKSQLITHLCATVDSELVQRIGHTITLFRRNAEKPRISLP